MAVWGLRPGRKVWDLEEKRALRRVDEEEENLLEDAVQEGGWGCVVGEGAELAARDAAVGWGVSRGAKDEVGSGSPGVGVGRQGKKRGGRGESGGGEGVLRHAGIGTGVMSADAQVGQNLKVELLEETGDVGERRGGQSSDPEVGEHLDRVFLH
ncbi:hypothetical protein Cni_G17873 [Canna indica]|uniref:Uncharacterized protein n=1 Tax=Canna indica TaxID=4628 RepID=A0AAQ3QI60_9LILI|nr:hypothetical protein Cni_G17873 [Canna indica]